MRKLAAVPAACSLAAFAAGMRERDGPQLVLMCCVGDLKMDRAMNFFLKKIQITCCLVSRNVTQMEIKSDHILYIAVIGTALIPLRLCYQSTIVPPNIALSWWSLLLPVVLTILVISYFFFVRKWHHVACCSVSSCICITEPLSTNFPIWRWKVSCMQWLRWAAVMQCSFRTTENSRYIMHVRYWWNLEGPCLSLIIQWYLQSDSLLKLQFTDGNAKSWLQYIYWIDTASFLALNCCTL